MAAESKSEKISNAYLIIYSSKKSQVLVAQKQVISYSAIAGLKNNRSFNQPKFKKLIDRKNVTINPKGIVRECGKRFCGALLPAGGKSSFFGGAVNAAEEPKVAAIREFKEEMHVDLDIKPEWLEEISKEDWGGVYYGLDIDNFPITIDIDAQTKLIRDKEAELIGKMEEIYNPTKRHKEDKSDGILKENFPEMHNLEWVDGSEIVAKLNHLELPYIESQTHVFCEFLLKILNVRDDGSKTKLQSFHTKLLSHIKNNEPIDGNITAATKLLEKLRCQKEEKKKEAKKESVKNAPLPAGVATALVTTGGMGVHLASPAKQIAETATSSDANCADAAASSPLPLATPETPAPS